MPTSAQAISAEKTAPCLARRPILTKEEKVIGYDVLLRETSNIFAALEDVGLDVICDDSLAFIPCTQEMLVEDAVLTLPLEKVVLEIPPDVPASSAVIEACERLKKGGYKIAIDKFCNGDDREPLLPFAAVLKVDWESDAHAQLASAHARKPYKVLAQNVDSRAEFLNARKAGFTLFQGNFFRHPEQMRVRQIPASQTSKLRLLQAVSAREIDFDLVEELIRHDASLCVRLLRYLNSPLLGFTVPVQSVRQAMNLLGEKTMTQWIRTATTLTLGQPKCSDLMLASLVRARFCELIAPKMNHASGDLFLIGMLSLMDAILETPLHVLVGGLALDPHAKAALLAIKNGGGARLSPVCDLMMAREKGDWERVATYAGKLNLTFPFVNQAYIEAMQWAYQMTRAANSQENKAH
jgi:c-di-GMP-related signal transduction protein